MDAAMWKVLIADDEAIIRWGIRDAVKWEALDMEVAAEAEDGEEALELAIELGIDVLLVDLSMPIMNGLTLVKHIREKLPECRIVIITGHDEFAYAQEAIRLSVDDYILKPTNPEQLTQVLTRIREDLANSRTQQQHLEHASKQITRNFPLLRERFCLEWIKGQLTEAEVEEQLRFLMLPGSSPQIVGVIRWPETVTGAPLMPEKERQLFRFAIENIAAELLEGYEKVLFRDDAGLTVMIIWGEPTDRIFPEIEEAVRSHLKLPVQVQAETFNGPLDKLAETYETAKSAVYRDMTLSPLVRRAKQFLQEHYSDSELTLESMADALQASPVYVSRLLKQELGMTFVGYLTQLRMKKAVQLLNGTELSINEIAERVGYDTQHYFSTAFKKMNGVSPIQYRKGGAFD
ncbi:response regulator [Paenibacillus sp. PR3]|uniref:Response regulator n=1 Tax=Paenibacillus terricola TaxID=2763503 RepID=A0ABR8N359_9BACL|nr:response regulator [Paenibacillus terricola]MBD3922608.1 response regulator [Paenibacillus terricola]